MRRVIAVAALAVISGPVLADVWSFETPSKNIQCSVGLDFEFSDLHCSIIEKSGTPPLPKPASCGEAWGHSFFMRNRGPVRMLCERVRSGGAQQVAEYGVTGEFGGFTCHSSKKGLECRNEDGHGFFLSRRRQAVF